MSAFVNSFDRTFYNYFSLPSRSELNCKTTLRVGSWFLGGAPLAAFAWLTVHTADKARYFFQRVKKGPAEEDPEVLKAVNQAYQEALRPNIQGMRRTDTGNYSFQLAQTELKKDLLVQFKLKKQSTKCKRLVAQTLRRIYEEDPHHLDQGMWISYKNRWFWAQNTAHLGSPWKRAASVFRNMQQDHISTISVSEHRSPLFSSFYGSTKFQRILINSPPPTPSLYTQCGLENLSSFKGHAYKDPFTQLATYAFQHKEAFFHLTERPEETKTVLVLIKKELHLVQRSQLPDLLEEYPYSVQTAWDVFEGYARQEFGEEKLQYIQHLYGFSFKEAQKKNIPLSPEHIYRINIGSRNTEIQDLIGLFEKLKPLSSLEEEENQETLLKQWVEEGILTLQEARGLYRVGLSSVLTIVEEYNTFEELREKDVRLLALVFSQLTEEEKEASYTGRKLEGMCKSWYASAGLGTYKPWIDQQQFYHFSDELERSYNKIKTSSDKLRLEKFYYELISHTICKYHLEKEHPTEIYRVGALIPALPDTKGRPRWFRVKRHIMNGYGIYTYQLEPLGKDSTLPTILLSRSTAISPYTRNGIATLSNDLNPLNSPGYLGIRLRDKLDGELFHQHTIPVWVGYLLKAQQQLEQNASDEELYEYIGLAEEAYNKFLKAQQPSLQLRDIVREFDYLFLDLLRNPSLGYFERIQLSNILYKCMFHKDWKKEKEEKTRFILLQLIEKSSASTSCKKALRKRLRGKLPPSPTPPSFLGDPKKVIPRLLALAKTKGELPEQKSPLSLVATGHSLGGAITQSLVVRHTSRKHRMPVPGQELSLFVYDDPRINQKDAISFIAFYNEHASLMTSLESKFRIIRSQEANDFVSFAGSLALGASQNNASQSWLTNENSLYTPLEESATDEIVTQSGSAHETRFQTGKENVDYSRMTLSSTELWEFSHPSYLPEDLYKQWKAPMASPPVAEWIRRHVGLLSSLLFPRSFDRDLTKSWKKHTDKTGVFVVDSKQGLLTKKRRLKKKRLLNQPHTHS